MVKKAKHTHRVSHVQRYNAKNRKPTVAERATHIDIHVQHGDTPPVHVARVPVERPKLLTPAEMTLKLRASSRQRVIVIDEKKENPT